MVASVREAGSADTGVVFTMFGGRHTVACLDGVRLSLLGSFRLTVDGRAASVPPAAQRILAFLALNGRHHRAHVAGSLWPEVDEDLSIDGMLHGRKAPGAIEPSVASE